MTTYTRQRYNARTVPRPAFSPEQEIWLKQELQAVQRGIPHPLYVDIRDFTSNLGAGSDISAALLKAGTEARNASRALSMPGGTFYTDSLVDFSSLYGVTIIGNGHNSSPSFDGQATRIIQRGTNVGILKVWGPCVLENLYLAYSTQQTTGNTASVALSLNDISGACFRNLKFYYANTSIGIPQVDFGASADIVFDSVFQNMQSYNASECHYDFRDYNGGGTNCRFSTMYINGGGSLDFVTPGQTANYAIRGLNWSGYEWGAVSIDGLTVNTEVVETQNCHGVFGSIRCEGVKTTVNNGQWFDMTGSSGSMQYDFVEFRSCKSLAADGVNTTHLFRGNATEYTLRIGVLRSVSCQFTTAVSRIFNIAGAPTLTGSLVEIGPISDDGSGLNTTTWTDTPAAGTQIVRRWNGETVADVFKGGTSNIDRLMVYRQASVLPPATGTFSGGDGAYVVDPGDIGRPGTWRTPLGGAPGTWYPETIVGIYPVTTQGDADATLTPLTSRRVNRFATTLTANRTVTLSTTNAWNGCAFAIARPAAGPFTLDVGGLVSLVENQWCVVVFDVSAFRVVEWGWLSSPDVYAPGSVTVQTGCFRTFADHLTLGASDVLTLQGDSCLVIL